MLLLKNNNVYLVQLYLCFFLNNAVLGKHIVNAKHTGSSMWQPRRWRGQLLGIFVRQWVQLIPLFVGNRPPVATDINSSDGAHFCIGSRFRPRRLKIHKQCSIVFSYDSFCSSIMVLTSESFHVCDALWAVSNYVRFYTGPRSNSRQPATNQFQ